MITIFNILMPGIPCQICSTDKKEIVDGLK